jgi:ribonuclease P/MRP protein subunit RPP1
MKITDACVYPHPLGDSTVRRMAEEAEILGYDSIVAIGQKAGMFGEVEVLPGVILKEQNAQSVITQAKKLRGSDTIVAVRARDNGFNRAAIGFRGIHILTGIHAADKTAFDHVAAKMAADNRVAIDLDISPLLQTRGIGRQRVIQRYRDILLLRDRFRFPITISSHARSVLEMRSVREIAGLCSIIGISPEEAGEAFAGVGKVAFPDEAAVKVVP